MWKPRKKKRKKRKKLRPAKGNSTTTECNYFSYAVSLEHREKPVGVNWYSRQRNQYTDFYHPCCGVRQGRPNCLKSIWPIPMAEHSGSLVIGGSKRKGGGKPQRDNHIPRGNTPTWTCCGKDSTSPGCFLNSRKMSNSDYLRRITAWEEEYEKTVYEEQNVSVFKGVARSSYVEEFFFEDDGSDGW